MPTVCYETSDDEEDAPVKSLNDSFPSRDISERNRVMYGKIHRGRIVKKPGPGPVPVPIVVEEHHPNPKSEFRSFLKIFNIGEAKPARENSRKRGIAGLPNLPPTKSNIRK